MLNKLYSILFLLMLAACNSGGGGGGGGSNGGGGNNPTPPTDTQTEQTKNYNLQASQSVSLGLSNEGFTSINFEQSPSQGSISGTYPNLTYTASPSASGSDSARILLTKSGATKRYILNFFINSVPVANNFSISLRFGQSINFDLQGTDIDGDPLTYSIIQNPSAGTIYHLTTGKEVGYDAANSPYVTNLFYTVSDGKGTSTVGRVDIFVVSELPVFTSSSSYTLNEDAAQLINLTVSSIAAHSYSITQAPINGSVSGTGANLTYTPSANYFGLDSFKVKATNAQGGFVEQTINLNITSINDAPTMESQSIATVENTDTFIIFPGIDVDSTSLTYSKVNDTTLGISFISGNRLFYYPNLDTFGVDSLTVQICDNGAPILCSQASVSITITREPKAPVAVDQNLYLSGGQSINITLGGTYYNLSNVTAAILTTPTKGTLVHNGGLSYTYTANLDGAGEILQEDFFSFTLSEDGYTSNQALVTLNIDYTPKYIGLNLSSNDFKEYSSLSNIIHQDFTEEKFYAFFETSYEASPEDADPFIVTNFNIALSNLEYVCPAENTSYLMLSASNLSAQSGEKITIDSTYNCDGGILDSSDFTEKIYATDNLIIRRVLNEVLDRTDTQIGIREASTENNTSLGFLSMLSLNNFDKVTLDLANLQKQVSNVASFSDLLVQDNVVNETDLYYFLKSDEEILNFQNPSEVLEIYHSVVEINNELILQEKYYLTTNGMRRVQDLYDEWSLANPDMEPTQPLAVPAGRILIIGDSILLNRLEKLSSYFEDNSLIYEYLEQTQLTILNRKVP